MSQKKASKFIEFLASYKGKVLFNFFYGFGAAIAILGTLFKILHLDGANAMLAIGLGTEVLMFAISAFEPPFRNYHWEEVFPVLKTRNPEDMPNFYGDRPVGTVVQGSVYAGPVATPMANAKPAMYEEPAVQTPVTQATSVVNAAPVVNASPVEVPSFNIPQINLSEDESKSLENSLKEYAEQMNTLNLHLKGLNTIYEIQLKDISSQIHTIDCINQSLLNIKAMYEGSANDNDRFVKETEAMAGNLSSLNQIYARMLQAMMSGQAFGSMPQGNQQNNNETSN
ncbi:MAG: gliding motility protein GldL [Bacteroidales bacterium]|nr:gliding motility protein GldL [Bacteroidales bacterium]MBO7270719.1 gliding motility protein GldL [Bacteroidales bacterium]